MDGVIFCREQAPTEPLTCIDVVIDRVDYNCKREGEQVHRELFLTLTGRGKNIDVMLYHERVSDVLSGLGANHVDALVGLQIQGYYEGSRCVGLARKA